MKGRTRSAKACTRVIMLIPAISAILLSSAVQAQNWPRFRGPNGQGISHAKTIPAKWTQGDYNWKVALPGTGYSSPAVWNNIVFITCSNRQEAGARLMAMSVSDGKILWEKEFSFKPYRMNRINSFAAATPAADADHVYALWPTANTTLLVAFDHEGEEVWKRTFPGVKSHHGPCTSPVVLGNIIVFTHENESSSDPDAPSFWIALDKKTGKNRWRLPRQTGPKISYSTPCVFPSADNPQAIVFTSFSHGVTGVNPRNGKVVWEAGSAFEARVVCSPAITNELIFSSCGTGSAGKYMVAVKPNDTKEPTEAYKITGSAASYVPTPLAADGLLFTCHDRGQISCLRAATSELLWQEKPAGRYYGSPVWVDGRLYVITTEGEVVVVKAAPKYELLGINPLGEKSQATPAVAHGRMYLRTDSHLISIGGEK
ncbi:MAG: PQQ-binding-like beta-propeller repeat protein [Phycisphaerae bacterium]|nr:PQQ-binding-like beta-propeller repeat protein [Phycisphaerae bacterium]